MTERFKPQRFPSRFPKSGGLTQFLLEKSKEGASPFNLNTD